MEEKVFSPKFRDLFMNRSIKLQIQIGDKRIGSDSPIFVIAEIGINHNGRIEIAKDLIDVAKQAGADAVKIQKRDPDTCVPEDQKDIMRDTPWGRISYLEYRKKVEFSPDEYDELERYADARNLIFFASPWDIPSAQFLIERECKLLKVASACLTDDELLGKISASGKPVIASTGMSSLAEIDHAFNILTNSPLALCHTTSAYPCAVEELNLLMIPKLSERYRVPIGYSGHEVGLATTLAAVALGAKLVERHITMDRTMWGSDQAASIEPHGFVKLVKDIRAVEKSLGDGVKRVYESERSAMKKLRKVIN